MRKGGNVSARHGFTIVETMIVLAVTSGMFVIAALAINGRQAKTEFQVAVRDLQTRTQQIINEVSTGYYPTQAGFSCTVGGRPSDPIMLTLSSSGQTQGAHDDCIFVGKTIVFNADKLYVYSLVGARQSNGRDVSTPAQARVTALAPTGFGGNQSAPDATQVYDLPYGLSLIRAGYDDQLSTDTTAYGVAIMSSLANFSTTYATSTGTQLVDVYRYTSEENFSSDTTTKDWANTINGELSVTPPVYKKTKSLRLCFAIHNSAQFVLLKIGDANGGVSVTTAIRDNETCT